MTKRELTETGAGQLVLTGRDVAAGASPTLRLPEPTEGLIVLRRGDLIIPQLTATSRRIPQVLTEQPATDLVLGPNLHLIRVNEARLDVHYLAGLLAATESTSTTGSGVHRLDLRRVTIPVPDLKAQRHQGAQFRRFTEFHTRLTDLADSVGVLTIDLTNLLFAGSG